MIDLHIHTNNSDGTSTTLEILEKAELKKLAYISITDHESCNAYDELKGINVKDYYSGNIIKGAELKNYYKDRVIDILAYDIDTDKFKDYLDKAFKDKTHEKLISKKMQKKK